MSEFAYVACLERDWEGPDMHREDSRVFLSEQAAVDYCEDYNDRYPDDFAHMDYTVIALVKE